MAIPVAKIITKTAGVIGAGLVLYDVNKTGSTTSHENVLEGIGNRLPDAYINSRRQDDTSEINAKIKDRLFRETVHFTLPDKINAVTGYLKGTFNQLAESIIPAAFAVGALALKSKTASGKLGPGAYSAMGLGACALYYIIDNVLHLGKLSHFGKE